MSERFLATTLPRHETAELYRLMVTGIRDVAVCLMDPHGIVTVWNRAAELIKGYCADDVVGRHLSIQYSEADRADGRPQRMLREAAAHGTHTEESWRQRKDGSQYWAHSVTTALRDEAGVLLGFSNVTTDLTRHKRLQQCERQQHEISLILRAAEAGTWKWMHDSELVEVSHHLLRILGYPADAPPLSLSDWLARIHPDQREQARSWMEAARSGPAPTAIEAELRLCCGDGGYRWFFMRAARMPPDPVADNAPTGCMGVCVQIDAQKRSEQEREILFAQLEQERARLAAILEQLPCGVVLAEGDSGRIVYRNPAAAGLMGSTMEGVDSIADYDRFVFLDHQGQRIPAERLPLARICRGVETGPISEEVAYARPGGDEAAFAITAARVVNGHGPPRQAIAAMLDVTDLRDVRRRAAAEQERSHLTLAAITEAVITVDHAGHITGLNPAARRLFHATGPPAGAVLCDTLEFEDEQCRAMLRAAVRACVDGRAVETSQAPLALRAQDGQVHWVEHALAPVPLADGTSGVVLVLHDVTESKRLMRRLGFEASHDALTGLVNRREFEARLQRAIERSQAGDCAALLYLDVDQFKIVNDTCGHSAGDELLRQLARIYAGHVRERDTLARIGGDEFALIVEHCDVEHAAALGHKILDATRGFRYARDDRIFQVGVSIGLTPIDARTTSVEEAMRRADHACYMAKERGRNRLYVHQHGDVELAQRRSDIHWVTRVASALQAEHLRLYWQPIVAIGDSGPARHFEILLRLADSGQRVVLPGMFLPAAERYDLILKIDRWVLGHTLDWMAAHPDETTQLDTCSINLSRRTLADPSFHKFAADLIDGSKVPANKLCFEITEHGAIADMASTISFIEALSARGCRFSLDDFGTGMTSFYYLKQLPVDYIKIDGSFIQTMASSEVDFEMVRFTNDISHMMGRRTIAEYVSDAGILERLRGIGVDYAQGYWVGKPRPLSV